MKRIVLILLCCLLLSGCSLLAPTPTIAPSMPAQTTAPVFVPTVAPTAPTEAPTEPSLLALTVFRGDDNAEFFISEEVFVPAINETVIVEQLIGAGILSEGTVVNSISIDGTQLNIDFNQVFAERVCSMGTSGERIIVGSTVNTFLCAYGADCVCITVNGEILESGHVIYDFPLTYLD